MNKIFDCSKDDLNEIHKLGIDVEMDRKKFKTPYELNFEKVLKPWGYEYLFYQDQDIAITLLCINPESATSLHCHLYKETTMYVLQGNVEVSGINKKTKLKENESLRISKNTFHKTYTKKGAYLFEIEKPNLKLDLLRLKDDYGRNDSVYEDSKSYMKIRKNYDYIESGDVGGKNNFVKYIGNRKITIEQIKDLQNQKFYDDETSFILLGEEDRNYNELKGSIISPRDIARHKNNKAMVVSRIENTQTGSQYLSDRVSENKILVFTSIGDLNVHLIESMARNENLVINILPNDEISMKSLSAYNKVSKVKGIFIPSTSYDTLAAIPHLITNWIDSNYFNGILVDADFHKKRISKHVKQGFNKGIPLSKLLKVSSSKIVKIVNLNLVNRLRILFFMETLHLNPTARPKFLVVPINFCTNLFKLPQRNYDVYIYKVINLMKKYAKRFPDLFSIVYIAIFDMKYLFALAKCKRPIIVLGGGVLEYDDSVKKLLNNLEKFKIPIFTTRSAIGLLSNDSPNYYGRIGGYGSRIGNHIYNSADLILSIGVRYSAALTTRNPENFNEAAKKFIIDIDSSELKKKHFKNSVKFRLDAKIVLDHLSSKIFYSARQSNYSKWTTQLRTLFTKYDPHVYYSKLEKDSIYKFINDACLDFNENDFILVDGGEILHFVNQAAVVKPNQKWINISSLEEKNYALEAALGVYAYIEQNRELKNSRVKVFCDESSFWNSQEALHYFDSNNIPIDILLIQKNNSRFKNHSHKLLYPHSYVARDSNKIYMDSDSVINQLSSFSSRLHFEKKNHEINEVIMFKMSPEQEMNPRPAFEVSVNGMWRTKSLKAMDPIDELDSLIDAELKGILNECK